MILQSKYVQDENGVKFAPISTPNAVRWPDGSNLNDKLSALDAVVIEAPVDATDATQPITTLTTQIGRLYRIDVAVDTLAITLPAITDNGTTRGLWIILTTGTIPNVTIASADSKDIQYYKGYKIEAETKYELNIVFDGVEWIVASSAIEVPSV